ncbi:MAG TPA: NAD-dependent epimerase/dehydratase family protein [Phycisphaerae bacterium]|nr:NAD-dependent epimerase/dehydratase family protein [Phycisphaerae bacterium]
MAPLPDEIRDERELDDLLARPSAALAERMARLEGPLAILGVAGKMGLSLAWTARRAAQQAGANLRIFGVSRFSNPAAAEFLRARDIEAIPCDLLDPQAVAKLPDAANVIFMAGRKFGTEGDEPATWAVNTLAPAHVARRYSASRIVAFSTGCVYPLVTVASGGCTEQTPPDPVGEYAQSCLGRERVLEYFSRTRGTPMCLLRLNYAVDLRYGVLHDIARQIQLGEPVNDTVPAANVIWQGDANNQALLALDRCASPPEILNLTGPETFSVREVAAELAREMGKPVTFAGHPGERAYLNNSAKAAGWFGPPSVPLKTLIRWTARWVQSGGASLNKPTHFEVNTGKY